MPFVVNKAALKKSMMCPVGMHVMTLVEVEDEYISPKGNTVQPATFETLEGYQIKIWFVDAMMRLLIEFVEAADKIKFNMETVTDTPIVLKDYVGKTVAGSVSHGLDKNGKPAATIDNFFNADKVPF